MSMARHMALLVAKDLRIESRGRETLGLVLVLGILIVAVLGIGQLGGGADAGAAGSRAVAILWAAYLFAGVLCFEKTMAMERQDDALAALLLAPVDRGTIYLAKLSSNLALMLAAALIVTPVGIVLFGFDLSGAPLGFAAVMGLGMLGFAAVGTLFSAAVSSSRMRGGALALLVFPLSLPLVIASTRIAARMLGEGGPEASPGVGLLVAFDIVFVAASWLVFEFLLEP